MLGRTRGNDAQAQIRPALLVLILAQAQLPIRPVAGTSQFQYRTLELPAAKVAVPSPRDEEVLF
jgi:hypothetical protein